LSLDTYISDLYIDEDDAMLLSKQKASSQDFSIHISPEIGKLLMMLLRMINAEKVVEIGTHAGYSTQWLAKGLPDHGKLFTFERDQGRANMAKECLPQSPHFHKMTLLEGYAQENLPTIENQGPFDVIFIDAAKISYNAYLDWAEVNIRIGGLIIADDTLLSGAVHMENLPGRIRPTTKAEIQTFNKRLADSAKYRSILLPISNGLTIAQKIA